MSKEQLEKILKYITSQFNEILNISEFFNCWENTDREWEYDDGKIEYYLSSDVDELTYVQLQFLYDPKSDNLQLIRSGFNVDDCIMWKTDNVSQLTENSDYTELLSLFTVQMKPWYYCLINIKKIDDKAKEDKKVYNDMMRNIAKNVFKYDV